MREAVTNQHTVELVSVFLQGKWHSRKGKWHSLVHN